MEFCKKNGSSTLCSALLGGIILIGTQATADAEPTLPAGMPDGGCWADPMNNLIIKLSAKDFDSNNVGATASFNYQTNPTEYPGWCYSVFDVIENRYASYFSAKANLPTSASNSGYRVLTDKIDYRVSISTLGLVPFSDLYSGLSRTGPWFKGVGPLMAASIGNSGTVEFRLKKTLIGGAILVPGGIELARMYRYVTKESPSSVPIMRLVTEQSVIPIPVVCKINGGAAMNIDFKRVAIDALTSSAVSSPFVVNQALDYRCTTSLTQEILVRLVADSAGFSDAIRTSNKDVGVVMRYQQKNVAPGDAFRTRLIQGAGSDSVDFALVKRPGSQPASGPFTGHGILMIDSL